MSSNDGRIRLSLGIHLYSFKNGLQNSFLASLGFESYRTTFDRSRVDFLSTSQFYV